MKKSNTIQPIKNTIAFREYIKTCGYELVVHKGCANPWFNQDGLYAIIKADKQVSFVYDDFTQVFTNEGVKHDFNKSYTVRLSWKDLDNQEILKNRQNFFAE